MNLLILQSCTRRQLVDIAKEKGIKGYEEMSKDELVNALMLGTKLDSPPKTTTVFILVNSGKPLPLVVLSVPELVDEFLPADAREIKEFPLHKPIVKMWSSELNGSLFTLVAYTVITPKGEVKN